MNRIEMKEKAKAVIKGKVLFSFLVIFACGVIVGIPGSLIAVLAKSSAFFGTFGGLIGLVVGIALIPLEYGIILYFHNISNGRDSRIEDFLLAYRKKFAVEIIKARLLSGLYVFLGIICLVIPGIYFALKYSQIGYTFLDNNDIKYKEAMQKSANIMKGNIFELVVLYLSFLGWFILGAISFGILYVYVAPYMQATMLQFYYAKSGGVVISVVEDERSEVSSVDEVYKSNNDVWK